MQIGMTTEDTRASKRTTKRWPN